LNWRDARELAGASLILVGAAALVVALTGYLQAPVWQSIHAEEVIDTSGSVTPIEHPATGAPLARLRIPRIGLDVAVIEGTHPKDLLKAPGHLEGSALPGQSENCILAGHRDLHFRRLADLRPGDRVELASGGKVFSYHVETSRIIAPSERRVLEPGTEPVLTLITCYPFRFAGPAPKRYIVIARLDETPKPSAPLQPSE
jgi:LPXTG-site transpeptidase (sortase) family protein